MKHIKNPAKVFLSVLAVTLVCAFITPIAFNKAQADNPDLEKKLAEKYGLRFKFSQGSFSVGDANDSEENWTLENKNQKIIVNVKRGDIVVLLSPDEAIHIHARGRTKKDNPLLNLTESADTVTLTDGEGARSANVEIQVPRSFKGKLDLGTTRGDIEVTGVSAEALTAKSVRSDLEIKGTSIPFIGIVNVSGDIEIDSEVELSAVIENVRGDVKIATPTPTLTLFTLKSTHGKIENPFPSAQSPEYRIDVTTMNGDIEIE